MNRSQEIIQIFYKKNLSKDIIKYILEIEREKIYVECVYQMILNSYLFFKYQKEKIFYIDNKTKFLDEIKYIKGNFLILNEYKEKIKQIKNKNKLELLYINNLRF